MHKRPLAVAAVFFILGIVLAKCLPDSIKPIQIFVVTLIFITLTLTLSLKGRGKPSNIFLPLSIISFAALLYIKSNIFPDNHISHVLGKDKVKAEIIGVIKSPALTRKPYYGKISSTYLFKVEKIEEKGVTGLAQIRIQTEKDYRYGDRLLVKGTIKRPYDSVIARNEVTKQSQEKKRLLHFTRNDKSGFNYREYLERQNIFALVNAKESSVTILAHDYRSNIILRHIYSLREKLKNHIIREMPLENAIFLNAILLGDRSELPKCIQESFKNSGTMHILPIQNTKKLNCPS